MKLKHILCALLVFPCFGISGQNVTVRQVPEYKTAYRLGFDPDYTQVGMAENIVTVHHGISNFIDIHFGRWSTEETAGEKLLGMAWRFGKLATLDFLMDYYTVVGTHEVFGHGFRFRMAGYTRNSYNVVPPPPFGPWGGFAVSGLLGLGMQLGAHDNIAISQAGSEGSRQIAHTLRDKWLDAGEVSGRQGLLYLMAFHDMTGYIATSKSLYGGDPGAWLRKLDGYYGDPNTTDMVLDLDGLHRLNYLNFANTFSFIALYRLAVNYIYNGKSRSSLPMIPLPKRIGYLPAVRMGMAPFGAEVAVEHFFRQEGRGWLSVTHRHGAGPEKWLGIGLRANRVDLYGPFSFRMALDVWKQPGMELSGLSPVLSNGGPGIALSFSPQYRIMNRGYRPLGVFASVGYKTAGYMEGEKLSAGWMLRFGFSFHAMRSGK